MKKFRLKKKVKVAMIIVGIGGMVFTTLKVSNIFINATKTNDVLSIGEKGKDDGMKLPTKSHNNSGNSSLLGELEDMVLSEPRVQRVIDNYDSYPEEIIKLLISKPESIEYALEYLNKDKVLEDSVGNINLNEVPKLYQWDPRWGYAMYGDNYLGITGCAPTVLSMASMYLTKDTSLTPYLISQMSEKEGHYAQGQGTSWSLMNATDSLLGVQSEQLAFNQASINQTLENGGLVVLSVAPGDFTTIGHFILLVGIDSSGNYIIRDPNSVENTNKTWSYDVLYGQISNLWGLYA